MSTLPLLSSFNDRLATLELAGNVPILPFELDVLRQDFAGLAEVQRENGVLLGEAMNDTSETWHDNAAADQINANSLGLTTRARTISAIMRDSVIIEYPPAEINGITLGSIAYLDFGDGQLEPTLLTGAVREIPQHVINKMPENPQATTIKSPLGRAILGLPAPGTVFYEVANRRLTVTVTNIAQFQP